MEGAKFKASKAHGFVMTPEVLIAMVIVAFVLTSAWQGAFTVMNFDSKIKKGLQWLVSLENVFDEVGNSPTTWRSLVEKQQELVFNGADGKSVEFKVRLDKVSNKSQLYALTGKKFAYLSVAGPKDVGTFKIPVFLGQELEDNKEKLPQKGAKP